MSGDKRDNPADSAGAHDPGSSKEPIDFHGAAIISENGEEIPITEEMIKDACKKLDPNAEAEDVDD